MRISILLVSLIPFLSIPYSNPGLEPKSNGEIIKHSYYTLSYSEQNKQAFWVYYLLTKNIVSGHAKRTNVFKPDPNVKTGSAQLIDYKGSGYDRGHLCPAGSMDINEIAMKESFFLSNMSPQTPSFNRGIWKKLEDRVRQWAVQYDSVFVVSGPIFKENIGHIGPDKVTIPGYFYKVIYCSHTQQMIAFVMPNKKLSDPISSYVKTVDEVEQLTGIDFFYEMRDSLEDKLEAHSDTSKWSI